MNGMDLFKTLLICLTATLFISCSNKTKFSNIEEIDTTKISHTWYYFTETSFKQITLPQDAPEVIAKPWTEAIRISSAAIVPSGNVISSFHAFAVVNKSGLLAINTDGPHIYNDILIFAPYSAEGLVFSEGIPLFYLYRSTFFNEDLISKFSKSTSNNSDLDTTEQITKKPFLIAFNSQSKLCYPLTSYDNLKLTEDDQITGFFWNGKTWSCSAKKAMKDKVEFNYFAWEPLVPLTSLSPALSSEQFHFIKLSESEYRLLNLPKTFNSAPPELINLFSTIPEDFCFYISYRDNSGTSPINYYHEGNDISPLNAYALYAKEEGYSAVLFEDGTTYINELQSNVITAFRLPKLPGGYSYGEFVIVEGKMYIAWEQREFYKTQRAGFLCVDLKAILSKAE